MMLTKAQVEYIKKYLIHNPRDGTETLRLKIADMIDTDAALRARVEELLTINEYHLNCATDALLRIKALEAHQQLHDRIFARQKLLLQSDCARIVSLERTMREAIDRLLHSSHSTEQPEPYESRAPIIRAFLQAALTPTPNAGQETT